MAIDFVIPDDAKEVRARVRKWVQDECIPAEKRMADGEDYKTVLADLRKKARAQGLWLPAEAAADLSILNTEFVFIRGIELKKIVYVACSILMSARDCVDYQPVERDRPFHKAMLSIVDHVICDGAPCNFMVAQKLFELFAAAAAAVAEPVSS